MHNVYDTFFPDNLIMRSIDISECKEFSFVLTRKLFLEISLETGRLILENLLIEADEEISASSLSILNFIENSYERIATERNY
jgi:hypothetical protein